MLDPLGARADKYGMKPAVFFDRDNTLIVSDGYLGDAGKVVLVHGAAEAIARLRGLGFAIVVVSNQSGIARGMFDEEATQAVNARLDAMLKQQNPAAVIDLHEYCPHHPEAPLEKYRVECDCRKPKPGMLLKAGREMGLDLGRSWMVGDAPRDIEAGKAAGCRTVLYVDMAMMASPAQGERLKFQPDFRVSSLKEAVDIIEAHVRGGVVNASPEKTPPGPAMKMVTMGGVQRQTRVVQPAIPASMGDPLLLEQLRKLNTSSEAILGFLRRQDSAKGEHSTLRMSATMVQFMVFAAIYVAFVERGSPQTVQSALLWAILLQLAAMTMNAAMRR